MEDSLHGQERKNSFCISENFQSFDMNIFAKLKSFPRTRFFTPYIWNGIKNSTLVLYEQAKTVSRIFRFREIPDVANIVPVYMYSQNYLSA